MSRPRFLVDHDFRHVYVEGARHREPLMEFVRVRDVGLDQAPDDAILAYAAENGFIVLSHDVNTMSAAASERIKRGSSVSGLLLAAQNAPTAEMVNSLLLIWNASEAEEWANRIWYLPL